MLGRREMKCYNQNDKQPRYMIVTMSISFKLICASLYLYI